MADDGDAEKAEGAAKADKRGGSETNEWTLSDSRGPLGAAESSDEASERAPTDDGSAAAPSIEAQPASDAPTRSMETPASDTPSSQAERGRVPVLPIIAALVVGAVIGAGSAGIVYKSMDQGVSQGDVNALSSRVEALEKRPDPQPELDQLKASIDKVAAAPKAQAFDPAPLQQKIAGLESDVDGLKAQDADHGLADKVTALQGTLGGLKTQGVEVKSLDDKVAGLDDKVAGLATAVDGLKKQDATTQGDIATLQNSQKTLEGKAGAPALAVVADSLIEAISRGKPYANQVEAAAALGADPAKVAVLRENADKGVPSAQALAAKFAPLADPLAASGAKAPANAGFADRLKAGMLSMVSIRRADGTTGDDPASRVSRIEADLAHDDVAGAYAAWDGLPPAAKAKSDAWGALAKTHVEAMGAARALQQQAIAALGAKKS